MKSIIWLVVVIAGLFVVPAVHAQVYSRVEGYACNACSYGMYRHTAIEQGVGMHLVYDLANDQLHYYKVTRERYGYGGGWLYQTTELTVPLDLQTWFERARAIWLGNGQTRQSLEIAISIHADWLTNLPMRDRGVGAYDVVERPQYAADFVDTLSSFNAGGHIDAISKNLIGILQAAGGIIMNDNSTVLTINVELDDGSKLKFVWRNGQDRPKFVAAWDANNNPIPMKPSDVGVNLYRFENYHPDLGSFTNLMRMYGIPITVSHGVWQVACVSVGDGRIVCRTEVR